MRPNGNDNYDFAVLTVVFHRFNRLSVVNRLKIHIPLVVFRFSSSSWPLQTNTEQ